MRKTKAKILFLLGAAVCAWGAETRADHLAGADFSYRCLGNGMYEIELTVYRDCDGIPLDYEHEFFIYNGGESGDPNALPIFTQTVSLTQTLAYDPSAANNCAVTDPNVCLQIGRYRTVLELPPNGQGYEIFWGSCCRNMIVSNLASMQGVGITIFVPPVSLAECNNLAQFNQWPPLYLCVNDTLYFDHSATDPDGDSLAYEIIVPNNGIFSFESVTYLPNYSVQNPFGPGGYYSIDPQTGLLRIFPAQLGVYVIAVRVSEYRDGTLIGYTWRDVQFRVVPCNIFGNPTISADYGAHVVFGDTLYAQAGQTVCYEWIADDDPGTFLDYMFFGLPSDATVELLDDNPVPLKFRICRTMPPCGANQNLPAITLRVNNTVECPLYNAAVYSTYFRSVGLGGVDAGPGGRICLSQSLLLQPQGPLPEGCAFRWYPAYGLSSDVVLQPVASPDQTVTYILTFYCGEDCLGDTVTVFVDQVEIVESIFDTLTFCEGANGVILPTQPLGNLTQYSFWWEPQDGLDNPTALNPVASPSQTTVYTLFVLTPEACTVEASMITVVPIPTPVVSAGQDRAVCRGTPVHLHAEVLNPVAGTTYGYEWQPQDGLVNPFSPHPFWIAHQTRTFTVRVRDNLTFCHNRNLATVTITALPIPYVDAGPAAYICPGDSTILNAQAGGGAADYTYEWTPALGLNNPTSATPRAAPPHSTRYSVRATSAGCPGPVDSVWVYVVPTPTVALTNVVAFCPGDSVKLETLVSGRENYRYDWQPAYGLTHRNGETWAAPETSTVYTLTVSSPYCTETHSDTVRVTRLFSPTTSVLGEKTRFICAGETLKLSGYTDALNYEWAPSAGLTHPRRLETEAAPVVTTVYTLFSRGGECAGSDSLTVVVVDVSDIAVVAEPDRTLCPGETARLWASAHWDGAAPQWSWMTPTGQEWVGEKILENVAIPGVYTVTAHFSEKCKVSRTVEVANAPAPQARFLLSLPTGCVPFRLGALNVSENAVESRWHFGEGDWTPESEYVYLRPGRYAVRLAVMGVSGCTDTAVAEVNVDAKEGYFSAPVVRPTADTLFLPHARICFEDTTRILLRAVWHAGDGTTHAGARACHDYLLPGNYVLVAQREAHGGCVALDTLRSFVVLAPELDIPNIFTPNGDGQNDFFRPRYRGAESFSFIVSDRWGRMMFRGNEGSRGWDGLTPEGRPAVEGAYVYVVVFDEKRVYKGTVSLTR